jgi:hypothetical protein
MLLIGLHYLFAQLLGQQVKMNIRIITHSIRMTLAKKEPLLSGARIPNNNAS